MLHFLELAALAPVLKKEIPDEKRGLIAGYKPNKLSLYLLLLNTGRTHELD